MGQFTRREFGVAAGAAALAITAAPARAGQPPIFTRQGLALGGTDPVAYFEQGEAVAGNSQHTLEWNGATWHFASAENRDAFAADPETYAPQYGGYCAYAVSKGHTAPTIPEAWDIVDGKLYLNYNLPTQSLWQQSRPDNITQANGHWPKVLEK